jgi:hypothetical protein
MSNATSSVTGTAVEFIATDLKTNAAIYRTHKRIVDAASRYDNIEDAKAGLKVAWDVLEAQIEKGTGYTPDAALGFGSDSAAVIAESILGRRQSVGMTRKRLNELGK